MMCLKVQKEYKFKLILLDDREFKLNYKGYQKCEKILIDVAKILSLQEKEYFSFKYYDADLQLVWIDLSKTINSQFKSIYIENNDIVIYFHVKHYITDPCKLNHELTRYLYYLQLRKDILQGRLILQFDYAVDLFSYFLQDELGDFNPKRDTHGYASEFEFMPNQSIELEKSAEAKHLKLKGMTQAAAEMNFLNKAKWLDSYGVDSYPVLGENNTEYMIGITPTGISVYQNNSKINSYFWPRISKLSYNLEKLMLTAIDKSNKEDTHVFNLKSKANCKHLFKTCDDHLKFFKIKTVYKEPEKINTALATSKNKNNSKPSKEPNKNFIKRVPAKRIKRRQSDYLKDGLNDKEEDNNKISNEEVINENGNLVFKSVTTTSDSDNNNFKFGKNLISPAVSTKTVNSNKYSNQRPESASEGENAHRRKHGRNRSRNRRSYGCENNNNEKNQETESDNENKNLARKKPAHKSETRLNENNQVIHRSSSNRSSSSRRRHQRSHSKSSNRFQSHDPQLNNFSHHKSHGKSRKSLTSQKSGSNLKKYEPTETCHETEYDENDINEIEKKRQIRRRKRSKSPGAVTKPPEEILQHINYNIIEANGMSADQLKEIPFVKIETSAPPFRISPHQNKRRFSPHKRKSQEFHDSKNSIAYLSNGKAQIKKLNDNNIGDYVMINIATKQNTVSMGSAVNSKLNHFSDPGTNNGFSADSGCEDMTSKTDLKQVSQFN